MKRDLVHCKWSENNGIFDHLYFMNVNEIEYKAMVYYNVRRDTQLDVIRSFIVQQSLS